MTEAEWLSCTDWIQMLSFLQGSTWASRLFGWLSSWRLAIRQRKYRLCICACCRCEQAHLSESTVEVAERFADGLASRRELRAAQKKWIAAAYDLTGTESWWQAFQKELSTSSWDIDPWLLTAASAHEFTITDEIVGGALMMAWDFYANDVRCALLRDLFGNPFRPPFLAPSLLRWNQGIIVKLAQQAYDRRLLPSYQLDHTLLMVLADALEEAGCTNADILNHCRQPGEHVRGCWAIDLLLGKE